eukprot:3975049-Pyramimonas_sp.AAC.1
MRCCSHKLKRSITACRPVRGRRRRSLRRSMSTPMPLPGSPFKHLSRPPTVRDGGSGSSYALALSLVRVWTRSWCGAGQDH